MSGRRSSLFDALLSIYAIAFFLWYVTHLDLYLNSLDLLPLNPLLVAAAGMAPAVLFLVLGRDTDLRLGNGIDILCASAAPLGFFVFWLLVHVWFMGPALTLSEEPYFTVYFPIMQLALMVVAMLIFTGPNAERQCQLAARVALAAVIATIIYDGFHPGTFSIHPGRAAGLGMNANVAALNMLLLLAISTRFDRFRLADSLFIATSFVALLLTFSRGGLVLMVIFMGIYGSVIIAADARRGWRDTWRLGALVAAIAVMLAAGGTLVQTTAIARLPEAAKRVDWLSGEQPVTIDEDSRLALARYYLQLAQGSGWFGRGTASHDLAVSQAPERQGSHNMLLRVLIDHGVLGLVGYLGWLLSALAVFAACGFWPGVAMIAMLLAANLVSHNIPENKSVMILIGAALALSYHRFRGRRNDLA